MKFLFLLAPLVVFSTAHAKLKTEAICRDEVNKILPAKVQKQFWWKDTMTVGKDTFQGWQGVNYKPAVTYGYAFNKDHVFISETPVGKKSGKLYSFSEPKCQVKTSTFTPPKTRVPSQAVSFYSDQDLANTINANEWGVIYVWSPGMPLSLRALAEIKKAVAAKGGHLTVLMDPYIGLSVEHAKEIMQRFQMTENDFRRVNSEALMQRKIILHYPAAILYAKGVLSPRTYVGHKKADVYTRWIDIETTRTLSEVAP